MIELAEGESRKRKKERDGAQGDHATTLVAQRREGNAGKKQKSGEQEARVPSSATSSGKAKVSSQVDHATTVDASKKQRSGEQEAPLGDASPEPPRTKESERKEERRSRETDSTRKSEEHLPRRSHKGADVLVAARVPSSAETSSGKVKASSQVDHATTTQRKDGNAGKKQKSGEQEARIPSSAETSSGKAKVSSQVDHATTMQRKEGNAGKKQKSGEQEVPLGDASPEPLRTKESERKEERRSRETDSTRKSEEHLPGRSHKGADVLARVPSSAESKVKASSQVDHTEAKEKDAVHSNPREGDRQTSEGTTLFESNLELGELEDFPGSATGSPASGTESWEDQVLDGGSDGEDSDGIYANDFHGRW